MYIRDDLSEMARMAAARQWTSANAAPSSVVLGLFYINSTANVKVVLTIVGDNHDIRDRMKLGNRQVALREVDLHTSTGCCDFDAVVAFLPDPASTRAVDVVVRMFRKRPSSLGCLLPWLSRSEYVEWTCRVQPAHVWPMTPLVGGVAPFPVSRYRSGVDGWHMRVTYNTGIRLLVGTVLAPSTMMLPSELCMPGGAALPAELAALERRHVRPAALAMTLELPDVEASLVEARRRGLVARGGDGVFGRRGQGFKELAEAVWAPNRLFGARPAAGPRTTEASGEGGWADAWDSV